MENKGYADFFGGKQGVLWGMWKWRMKDCWRVTSLQEHLKASCFYFARWTTALLHQLQFVCFSLTVKLLITSKTTMNWTSTGPGNNLVPRVSLLCLPWSLVAAGHVTTQNLGGKKIYWLGGVVECFVWLIWQTLWVSNPLPVANNYSLYRGSKSNLPMKNASRFLPSSE